MTVRTHSQQNGLAPETNRKLLKALDDAGSPQELVTPVTTAMKTLWDMETHIRWEAQTVHQAYHLEQAGFWWNCPKSTCRSAQQVLEIEEEDK